MRQQAAVQTWATFGPALTEEGRNRLITDAIASSMGYLAAARYNPQPTTPTAADDQKAEAMQWVGTMKVGVPPVVTKTQNPVIYATTFLQAAVGAMQSVQQGANPYEVLRFLQLCGPAIQAHLQRFPQDPARKQVQMAEAQQLQQIAAFTDELQKQIAQNEQAQQQQQQKTQAVLTDEQLAQLKTQSDIQIKQAKTQAQMTQSEERHQQKMRQAMQDQALKDAQTAANIHLDRIKTTAEVMKP